MSEFAPSFPLFIGSFIGLIYCVYSFIFRKENVKEYKEIAKLLFFTLFVVSGIVFLWGLTFIIIYFLG